MSADKPKIDPNGRDGGEEPVTDGVRKPSGRVKHDERGNAVWEWSVATGTFSADVTRDRLRRLENQSLSLAEDAPSPFEVAAPNPHGLRKGYDPYASGRLSKPAEKPGPKKTDLRRLSEWMKLKKQHAKNKDET